MLSNIFVVIWRRHILYRLLHWKVLPSAGSSLQGSYGWCTAWSLGGGSTTLGWTWKVYSFTMLPPLPVPRSCPLSLLSLSLLFLLSRDKYNVISHLTITCWLGKKIIKIEKEKSTMPVGLTKSLLCSQVSRWNQSVQPDAYPPETIPWFTKVKGPRWSYFCCPRYTHVHLQFNCSDDILLSTCNPVLTLLTLASIWWRPSTSCLFY